ncbi:hypothetical protein, partial [Kitasatospora cinereorecta]
DNLTPDQFWPLLASAWVESEIDYIDFTDWLYLWTDSDRGYAPELVMTAQDYKAWQELPETVTAYRGYDASHTGEGLSWSLNRDIAERFANRCNGEPVVIEREFKRSDIIAYLGFGKEDELIINPELWFEG